jgi:tellurite resistance protein TehA-like permease
MNPTRIIFLALSGAILVLGLFVAAAARELPLAIFGWGLVVFGAFFAFTLVKQTMDEEEASRH